MKRGKCILYQSILTIRENENHIYEIMIFVVSIQFNGLYGVFRIEAKSKYESFQGN